MTYSELKTEVETLVKMATAMNEIASRDLGKLASDVEESFADDPRFQELQAKFREQLNVVHSLAHCF